MMFVATFLMGVVGVTTALQNTWWSPPRNLVSRAKPIGTIDFRYPDWVVSPRPPCLSEGVFPHPRSSNCTWYYRCTARVGIPRFATFYFECEPGTMFDDDLDQCVHPHSGANCQGGGQVTLPPTPVCTTIQSSCRSYASCDRDGFTVRSVYLCRSEQCTVDGVAQRVSNICPTGQLFSRSLNTCVQEPSGGNPCPEPTCEIEETSCEDYDLCDPTKNSVRLCALQRCGQGTQSSTRNVCKGQQLYDTQTWACVDKPLACPITTKCVAVASSCKKVKVCTGASQGVRNLCRLERCTRDGRDIPIRPMCTKSNLLYDVDQNMCVIPPAENTCSSCEFTKSNCRDYDLCNPSGVRRLCDCSGCASGMMYDPSTKVCIAKTAICPVLECVFRDSVCGCLNSKSLCTGCYMRGSFIPVSQFCKAQANPEFYHVEQDTCLYSNPGFLRAESGHCPRTRYSSMQPSLQCSLRANSIIRCWSDDMF